MSRVRIKERVRKNIVYTTVSAELDRLGLSWEVVPATGKGHPIMAVEIAGVVHRRPMPCTPSPRTPRERVLGDVRRWLRDRGVEV